MFQSSPGLLAGRDGQTHPWPAIRFEVSILARPFGRALRSALSLSPPPPEEFLSSPGLLAGRYGQHGPRRTAVAGFNPRPAFWPGATCSSTTRLSGGRCFNPRPAFWPGATPEETGYAKPGLVSILARPFGRALHLPGSCTDPARGFQSSPGLLAGRYAISQPALRSSLGFNPRPAFWPGATPAAA